jgi:hypothetical protein
MKSEAEEIEPLKSGAKLASEYLLPGGSNLIEGDFVQGGIHAALGLIARTMLGLPGLIAVSANSFTKAMTGRHIHEHLCQVIGQNQKEQTSHQEASHNSYAEIKASDSSQSALIPQSPPVSQTGAVTDDSSQSAHPLPQSAAERKQPSPRKRPSSSKTNKET